MIEPLKLMLLKSGLSSARRSGCAYQPRVSTGLGCEQSSAFERTALASVIHAVEAGLAQYASADSAQLTYVYKALTREVP